MKEEIQGVFLQFSRMKDKLGAVNTKLESVVKEEESAQEVELDRLECIKAEVERNIEKSKEVAQKANKEIEANKELQEKVSEFLPN